MNDYKATCNCSKCTKKCIHANAFRRLPKEAGARRKQLERRRAVEARTQQVQKPNSIAGALMTVTYGITTYCLLVFVSVLF